MTWTKNETTARENFIVEIPPSSIISDTPTTVGSSLMIPRYASGPSELPFSLGYTEPGPRPPRLPRWQAVSPGRPGAVVPAADDLWARVQPG
jgi:hypothetical protein